MRVLFCGLGSIGKRHLKNLIAIAREADTAVEIHALRKTDGILEDEIKGFVTKQIADENKLESDYDIAFVTNPTNLHYKTIQMLAGKTKHMFIEKPIFDHGEYKISDLKLNENGVYYVAGPLRYSGVIQRLKKILSEEKIYCVRVICSSYLPDWRPNTDYRLNYSAHKDQGGGVAIDLIHEWDYISYLFGFPQTVYCMRGKHSHLEIDSEDIAVYIADYKDKLVELHLDYFGKTPRREIELFTEKGTITGDLIRNAIFFTYGKQQISFEEEKNDIYVNEMSFFTDQILKNQNFNNLEYCNSVLNIALGKGVRDFSNDSYDVICIY